jgi:NAD(P)-dependent dehydrogenase (short-subunit alcohol dehydrogenase family)
MPTPMIEHQAEERKQQGVDPGQSARPTGATLVEPRDVALAHLFLVSDDGASVNGQTIFTDGGRSVVMAASV